MNFSGTSYKVLRVLALAGAATATMAIAQTSEPVLQASLHAGKPIAVAVDEETRSAEAEWMQLRSSQSLEELGSFIRRYASSPLALEASRRIDDIEWEKVDKSDDAAVNKFLATHPDRGYTHEARTSRNRATSFVPVVKASDVVPDWDAIDGTIRRYAQSIEKKHLRGVRASWPRMPGATVKALQAAFEDFDSIGIDAEATEEVQITAERAVISRKHRFQLIYDGLPKESEVTLRFSLRKTDGRWVIEGVTGDPLFAHVSRRPVLGGTALLR